MISVIIPMYNSESTICKVLDSVRCQTRFDYINEILVIDDGSTDSSVYMVEQYSKVHNIMPIRIFKKTNGGASSARNIGLKNSSNIYVALLDSDDIWLPNKLERQMEVLLSYPEIFFLGSNYVNGKIHIPFKNVKGLYKATAKDICWCNFPVTPSVIFKREVIEKVGYFDEAQLYGEDINYFQRIGAAYNYYFLSEELVDIGINKSYFGESGLTRNLHNMHLGTKKNIYDMYKTNQISIMFYYMMSIFYEIKYYRRVILSKIRKRQIKR